MNVSASILYSVIMQMTRVLRLIMHLLYATLNAWIKFTLQTLLSKFYLTSAALFRETQIAPLFIQFLH